MNVQLEKFLEELYHKDNVMKDRDLTLASYMIFMHQSRISHIHSIFFLKHRY